MKDAKDLFPWKVTDISIRPYEGFWSMNPSIHYDGALWRCTLRAGYPSEQYLWSCLILPANNSSA